MLIKVTIENFKSFDKRESLSMLSSGKIRVNPTHKMDVSSVGILKNAVVYGANASGKSNLIKIFSFIKTSLLEGIPVNSSSDYCKNREENKTRESFFELQFSVGEKFYAYGFSAILSERKIVEEGLYELSSSGNAKQLFIRELGKAPQLGSSVRVRGTEKNRFEVYANDFINHDSQLFLAEMNRGKKYEGDSPLAFLVTVFDWLINHIIVLYPNMGITNTKSYYNDKSLERIKELICTFDTGISDIRRQDVSIEEMSKKLPPEIINNIIQTLKQQMQVSNTSNIQMSWRLDDGFYNIKIEENGEPEISTLVLKHGESLFDFDFAEESDGTKRLFDLVDMLLTQREDTVYVVDELERSLHPKLTEHFLKLFMEAHMDLRMQMLFTTHEDTIMDQELFRRDEIWFVERNAENASLVYSLDKFKERYDKKLGKAYLEGRYGAIPVFKQFSFKEEA